MANRDIEVYDINMNSTIKFYYDVLENLNCPMCDTMQMPFFKCAICNEKTLFLFCCCLNCKKAFITEYSYEKKSNNISLDYREIKKYICSYPVAYQNSNFDDYIKSLSPAFIKIYEQSVMAEKMNLDEIYGMGYRKAFEFLLKDYALTVVNDDVKEKIPAMLLSQVIDSINDNQIKQYAIKCTWLLNDETHYIRKFKKTDIDDIKKLINAVILTLTARNYANSIQAINNKV